jgi:aryl-alcohol dehydrogenase-like predicted oxidoreductase
MNGIEWRMFGQSGLRVSALGFGAGHIGGSEMTDAEAAAILHRALDQGINLVDTARGYGRSEARIGLALGARRPEVILSTKIGYGISGYADWSAEIIPAGVTEALRALRTEYIDIMHLHSCPVETLERSGVVEALQREVQAGRVRVAAYSGDNESLQWAVTSGVFGSVQCSFNICDQRSLSETLPAAIRSNLGVIAKRPIANGPWNFAAQPTGHYVEPYWHRFQQMGMRDWPVDWSDVALRFAAYTPGVHACIVGTRNMAHLEANIASVRRGPLDPGLVARIHKAFQANGAAWRSEV